MRGRSGKRLGLILYIILCTVLAYGQVRQADVDDFARNYAFQERIPLAEVEEILSKAEFQNSIIEKMERPAEKTLTWERYRSIFLTEDRINAGVKFWNENLIELENISNNSGIPEEIILGIIGVETFFGTRKGTYRVLDALYTLGFGYPPRSSYFKAELAKFLELCKNEGLDPLTIKGSYAGAMGYCQFMPTSYLAYAKSYDGMGGIDLINNVDDAMASVANYLKVHRWDPSGRITTKAMVAADAQTLSKQSTRPRHSTSHYGALGYAPEDGSTIDETVTLIEFENEAENEYWFCMNNFYVITRYNHSPLYALAVYQLGAAIKERKFPK
ncbi:lytic murein transglycosylase B [Marinoscillum sp. MHG1-6]|uniref:lytic murein transglycosylase B n=1 Tax=Marinoscillum sp. MHG1-6 TaxID=2959627 RepID=UPI0021580BC9|nr:lytic murein transglycosylase B [Marinoscillum sp. MHG1-6]